MKRKFLVAGILSLATGLMLITGCGQKNPEEQVTGPIVLEEYQNSIESTTPSEESTEETDESLSPQPSILPESEEIDEQARQQQKIHLMAVGDCLMHMGVINSGKQADGTYNYDFLFENISDFLNVADIKIINQETILGGNHFGFSGYPAFNSPTELGDSIANMGFNVVQHASNHTLDKHLEGVQNCIAFWENYPNVLLTGIGEKDITGQIPLMTIGEYTFALLNYTYGTNLETFPAYADGYMNILCAWDPETRILDFTKLNPQVLEDIRHAKEIADVVIVLPHWGNEYTTEPTMYEKEFAVAMTEAGADLIIGTHPHVVQPVEWVTADNGNTALCYYSLGNYVSTQLKPICMLEGMAWVTFEVSEDGLQIDTENTGVLPLINHFVYNPTRHKGTYFLENYTEELTAAHAVYSRGLNYKELLQWSDEIFGENVLTIEEALKDLN